MEGRGQAKKKGSVELYPGPLYVVCHHCVCVNGDAFFQHDIVMHLSMLCPTTSHTGIGGARWGFVTVMVTNPPPLGMIFYDKPPLVPTLPHLMRWGLLGI